MTLLLNYRPVLRQPTGIGVYANAVLPALQQLPHLLIPGGGEGSASERLRRLAWTQLRLPDLARQHRASLIFTPAPEGYLGRQVIPQVVMVHDLRPITHPKCSLQSIYFRSWVPPLLRSCQHLLTNSEFTASEIQRCVGIPEDRISVVPLGYDPVLFHPDAGLDSASPQRPYFLHVGQAYPHKNLRRLIQAFAPLAVSEPELSLILVGKPHPTETPVLKRLVAELGLGGQVVFRPYVSATALPDLYRGALALVYPSLWEGFGLPVLEAMACGTPVLTSLGSGTEEVAGGAALLISPVETKDLTDAMQQLIEYPGLRDRLRGAGLLRASHFSWDRVAVHTREVLQKAVGP